MFIVERSCACREEYERRLNGDDENSSLLLKQHDSELSKLKRSIARLIDAYEDGLIDKQEFDPRIRQHKSRVSHLERERKSLLQSANEQAELHAIIQHLSEFTEQLSEGLESLDWTSKREVIRSLVKRVEIGESDVRVIYKVGPPPFVPGPASGASLQHCLRRHDASLWRSDRSRLEDSILHHPGSEKFSTRAEYSRRLLPRRPPP